jgi:universal stress protein E
VNRFQNVLVVASEHIDPVPLLDHAADLARRNDARLTVFDVVEVSRTELPRIGDVADFDLHAHLIRARRDELEALASPIVGIPVDVAVSAGVGFIEVIRRVIRGGHDLVVVGTDVSPRRMGLAGSSMAMHLLRKCPVPVWVETENATPGPDVAVAVGPFDGDLKPDSLDVTLLELGSSLASSQGGVLHVIHAWRLEGESLMRRGRYRLPSEQVDAMSVEAYGHASDRLDQLMAFLPDEGVDVQIHLEQGEAGAIVPSVLEAIRPGVVVMGTIARAGLKGMFVGNTAEQLLGTIAVPVLAVKPAGFETPVDV